jgi:hypothetical protein
MYAALVPRRTLRVVLLLPATAAWRYGVAEPLGLPLIASLG